MKWTANFGQATETTLGFDTKATKHGKFRQTKHSILCQNNTSPTPAGSPALAGCPNSRQRSGGAGENKFAINTVRETNVSGTTIFSHQVHGQVPHVP